MVELALDRKIRVDDARRRARPPHEVGQAVVALRADHEVDGALAADDLGALGLGDAARHRDGDLVAGAPP